MDGGGGSEVGFFLWGKRGGGGCLIVGCSRVGRMRIDGLERLDQKRIDVCLKLFLNTTRTVIGFHLLKHGGVAVRASYSGRMVDSKCLPVSSA